MTPDDPLDCLIIGGGAAGLTAAVYLARYRRRLLVADAGESRLRRIPKTRNVTGFPDGVGGTELLERLHRHVQHYEVPIEPARVDELRRRDDGLFTARLGEREVAARYVLMATGARDVEPVLPGLEAGLAAGNVRYCPVCDGFETQRQRVAVLGRGLHGVREARFVHGFGNQVTWLAMNTMEDVPLPELASLREREIRVADPAPVRLWCEPGRGVFVELHDGQVLDFDVLYPALGLKHASSLAAALGAQVQDNGQLVVDDHQRTTVDGLFAAGDVSSGLNQITVAAGHAAIAATTIHNALGH